MSGFKGTKGKWEFEHNGYYFDINIKRTDDKIINAYVFCNVSENNSEYQPNPTDEETKANTLLMSKSLKMLEMLELLTTYYSADNIEKAKQLIKEATEI